MFIERLELQNFCQHRSLAKEFHGNLIGIVGPNGSGKSNLMDAMMFALCGSVPGKDKSELITDGQEEGHVLMSFLMPDDRRITVHRDLVGTGAWLKVGDGKPVKGITPVNAALNEMLGADKDLLKQSVFVRQAELDSILFLDPAVRERAWLRLIGLSDTVKIYTRLGPVVTAIPQNSDYEESIKLNLESLRADRVRIHQLWKRYTEEVVQSPYAAVLASCPESAIRSSRDGLIAALAAIASFERTAKAIQDQTVNLAYLSGERLKLVDRMAVMEKEIPPDPQKVLAECAVTVAESRKAANGLRTVRKLSAELTQAEQRLASMRSPAELDDQMTRLSDQAAALSSELAAAEGEKKVHETMASAAACVGGIGTTCPLCMQPVSDPKGLLGRLSEAIGQCSATVGRLRPALSKLQSDLSGLRTTKNYEQTARTDLQRWIESAKVGIASAAACIMAGLPANADPDMVEQEAARADKMGKNLQLLMGHVEADRKLVAGFDMRIGIAEGERAAAEKRLAEMGPMDVASQESIALQIREIDTALNGIAAMARASSEILSSVKEAYRNARTRIRLVKDLRRKNGMQGETRRIRGIAENVRDWFHHSKGPHGAVLSVLEQLTPDVNTFLGELSSPFSVIPDGQQLMFRYCMSGSGAPGEQGYPQASRLSGGEKVLLALSFRLASYCMFASKLGLLTLDEPTVYLDERNVTRMCHWMEKLAEIARKLKVQILISTHERAIIPMMDAVLDLTPAN